MSLRNPNPALASAQRRDLWEHSFSDHIEEGHDHDHGQEGHDHGAGPSRRSYLKHGTRLSLNVLGGGVHA